MFKNLITKIAESKRERNRGPDRQTDGLRQTDRERQTDR